MAQTAALAVVFGLFLWWFSTGAILWLATRPGRWPAIATVATAPVAFAAVLGLQRATGHTGPSGAFEAFSTAILLWGWFELSFLSGLLQGPRPWPCPPGASLALRFRAAWGALAWHELALAAALALVAAVSWGGENMIGLWTFVTLFGARISAKLNVFLGVPNLADEMLPPACAHLKTYFAVRPMNLLFPLSITALTVAACFRVANAVEAPAGSGLEVGETLIATLCALALLEHWLMALPVRDSALWRWLMPRPESRPDPVLPVPGRNN